MSRNNGEIFSLVRFLSIEFSSRYTISNIGRNRVHMVKSKFIKNQSWDKCLILMKYGLQ